MLFASDLDQTLIYSRTSLRLAPGGSIPRLKLVETYAGRGISYAADSTVRRLKRLVHNVCFVPVTTRTWEQYRRISLFRQELSPDYAVVSNGGNILVRGRPDAAWNRRVKADMAQYCAAGSVILARFGEIQHQSWIRSGREADGLFHCFTVERAAVPEGELSSFAAWAGQQNWRVSLQGRKLYLVPNVVNKWAAAAHVRDLTGCRRIVAAGDSLLDLELLARADFAIAPCHGEIWDQHATGGPDMLNIRFTGQEGIYAADEILDFFCAAAGQTKSWLP